jgi:molybdenum cofactor cytidylyltransferase
VKFGAVPITEAEGGILAHQARAGERVFRKSHLLDAADCAALAASGVHEVIIARLEAGDLGEDEAAFVLAESAAGEGVRVDPAFTGRANLFAEHAGLLIPDAGAIDAFNMIDPGMTIATLPAFKRVEPGEMIATVKIIPFALPEGLVEQGRAALAAAPLRVAPFREKRVAMVSLRLPGLKESIIEKTVNVTRARLAALGARLVIEERLAHADGALGAALAALDPRAFDILVIFGAAAIADRRDVIPAAIEARGGRIIHLGMPVDPGNLLLLAEFAGRPVIGAPGCARSPRENGFDFVLARLCAGLPPRAADIQRMGVGGLLMEIVSRPQPRAGLAGETGTGEAGMGARARFAGLVLAAGRSTRFGPKNKLLADLEGQPMLAHVLKTARGAGLDPIIVVTGHEADAVRIAVGGAETRFVHNPAFAEGLSTSLRAGIEALPAGVEGVFVLLGDMPKIRPQTLDALRAAADQNPAAIAFVPVLGRQWGNPVLVRRALFPSFARLHGDQGARKLLEAAREAVIEVEVGDPGIFADFDTRAAFGSAPG